MIHIFSSSLYVFNSPTPISAVQDVRKWRNDIFIWISVRALFNRVRNVTTSYQVLIDLRLRASVSVSNYEVAGSRAHSQRETVIG
jgi:hypothetical protein